MKFFLFTRPRGVFMSEENDESLTEVKSSLEVVFSYIRTLKREIHIINQKFSDFNSTIQAFEGSFSKLNETENAISELKTSFQVFNQLPIDIQEIKQTTLELQRSLNDQKERQEELVKPLNDSINDVQSKISTFEKNFTKITAVEESIEGVIYSFQELKESYSQQESIIAEIQTKIEEKIDQFLTEDESNRKTISEFETKIDGLNNRITNLEKALEEETTSASGILNRIKNLEEKAGISTGDLIGTGFDNLGMLRQLVSDLLGEEKVDQHIPKESGQDPILVIKALKEIIRDLSFIDESNSLNIAEILLRYSEKSGERADRRTLVVNFSNDIRRVLEMGQSVMMDIGQKRMQTRNIIEEIRNVSRQWTSEDDLKGETGIFLALDLLETLKKEF